MKKFNEDPLYSDLVEKRDLARAINKLIDIVEELEAELRRIRRGTINYVSLYHGPSG